MPDHSDPGRATQRSLEAPPGDPALTPALGHLVRSTHLHYFSLAWACPTAGQAVRDGLVALPEVSQVEVVCVRRSRSPSRCRRWRSAGIGSRSTRWRTPSAAPRWMFPAARCTPSAARSCCARSGRPTAAPTTRNSCLWSRPDGSRLLLGAVATVVDGLAETDQQARFDQVTAVTVSVFRSGRQSALDVAAAVRDYVERAEAWLPEGITLTIWPDQSQVLRDRLAILLSNGAAGFVLVFVVLTLFLEIRLAFWVSLGIPVSFLGAIALMPALERPSTWFRASRSSWCSVSWSTARSWWARTSTVTRKRLAAPCVAPLRGHSKSPGRWSTPS